MRGSARNKAMGLDLGLGKELGQLVWLQVLQVCMRVWACVCGQVCAGMVVWACVSRHVCAYMHMHRQLACSFQCMWCLCVYRINRTRERGREDGGGLAGGRRHQFSC